jgi:protein-serine/threonine kinase
MTVSIENSQDQDGTAIAAPPPSYNSIQMSWKLKSLFTPSSPPPSFTVPNDFDTASQKGFKSNSWFSNVHNEEKQIRRVVSAPNTKLLSAKSSYNSTVTLNSSTTIDSPLIKLRKSCRRTYSSSSIKVKKVEVGPSSFVKVRMLGKGDVGKVYMVKQKGTDKLYAMKGNMTKRIDIVIV